MRPFERLRARGARKPEACASQTSALIWLAFLFAVWLLALVCALWGWGR